MKLVKIGDRVINLRHLVCAEPQEGILVVTLTGTTMKLRDSEADQFLSAVGRLLHDLSGIGPRHSVGVSHDPETGEPVPH